MNNLSDISSATGPVSSGELSPDGRFRWEGGRWVYASRRQVQSQPSPAKRRGSQSPSIANKED